MADLTVIQDPTQSQLQSYEQSARRRAAQVLAEISAKITDGSVNNNKIHVRNLQVDDDLESFASSGSAVIADYTTPSFETTSGAAVGDQRNGLAEFNPDGAFENKAGIVYGFVLAEPATGTTCPFTEAEIETTNSTIATYDLTSIDVGENTMVLLEDPLVVDDSTRQISVYTEDDPSGQEFGPLATVAEKAGETVSTSDSFVSDQ